MYYNYHAKLKQRIESGALLHHEIKDYVTKQGEFISKCLVLYFDDGEKFVRPHSINKYKQLLEL